MMEIRTISSENLLASSADITPRPIDGIPIPVIEAATITREKVEINQIEFNIDQDNLFAKKEIR